MDNARRDRLHGKPAVDAKVDTRELADKVRWVSHKKFSQTFGFLTDASYRRLTSATCPERTTEMYERRRPLSAFELVI
jgi:hypothetical protein